MQNGGLRTKGIKKQSIIEKPLITVVTVVYNCSKSLESTILSVINQNYENVEYIIIDGDSKDGTLDIIKKYEDKIDYWISEPDNGIYDAMNKGINLATGDWINFMNSGDEFCNKDVINTLFSMDSYKHSDVIYGDSIEKDNIGERLMIAGTDFGQLYKLPIFRHNAAFFKSNVQKINMFKTERTDLGFALDYKCIYDLYELGYSFTKIGIPVVKYEKEGVSHNTKLSILYNFRIVREYNFIKAFAFFLYRVLYSSISFPIKKLLCNIKR